jgi:putative MFS transporter
MLEYLETQASLTGNQRRLLLVAILCDLLEFYDFFLIGFVLAFVAGAWKLTYGQSAIILLSSGVGAILGASFWGWFADRVGRRKAVIASIINFSVATGVLALTPENGWIFLSVFRFFVGVGVGGLYCVILPLVQEFMPSSKRGFVSGIVTAAVPLGLGLGAVLGGYLGPVIGWRGLFALGLLPALIILLIRAWMPESPLWLLAMGRVHEARESLAWALQRSAEEIPLPAIDEKIDKKAAQPVRWSELFRYPRSLAVSWLGNLAAQTGIYGLSLWAPTLLVQVLHISPARAATLMIACSISAFFGRLVFAWLSDALGRRSSGVLFGSFAAVLLVLASYLRDEFFGAVSVFWLVLVVCYFFADGGFAIVGPYAAEVWPARLRATGMGSAYGFGGIGKIIGPLGLALIVGSSDIVKPAASVAKIVPAFFYLGAWYAVAAIVYGCFGFETRNLSIAQIDSELAAGDVSSSPR